jgi:hypothetical protein
MSTTRLRTQTRVQFVVEVGESRARATTPSPNLNCLVVYLNVGKEAGITVPPLLCSVAKY